MDITQYIDLESYSSTPGFLGYTDNAPDFSEAGIDALCGLYEDLHVNAERMTDHILSIKGYVTLFL